MSGSRPDDTLRHGRSSGRRGNIPVGTSLCHCGAALLATAFVVSFLASPDRRASAPYTAVALVGSVGYLVLAARWADWLRRKVSRPSAPWLFLGIGALALVVTLFATDWPSQKLSWLESVYGALPSIRSLPWWETHGLQPNQTGGFLGTCVAFAFAVASGQTTSRPLRFWAITVAAAGTGLVFMTGSRAALAALVVAGLLVLTVRTRRWSSAWGIGLGSAGILLAASGYAPRVVQFFLRDETLELKLLARLDIWSSAILSIQDHFFTGIGLGVFNEIVPIRYPYQTVGLSYPVSQAHNLFLDTAVCLGIVGLVGLVLLLIGIARNTIPGLTASVDDNGVRLGLLASLLAYVVFGASDSISFSVPTSLIVWIWAAASSGLVPSADWQQQPARQIRSAVLVKK